MDPAPTDKREPDRRVERTRTAIVEGFNGLFFERPYDAIAVADIIDEAGVGRSTFYEHFRNKEEVLSHAALWVLNILADAATDAGDAAAVQSLLVHVRENRISAKSLLCGPAAAQLMSQLSDLIETRLEASLRAAGASLIIPTRLAAAQAAEMQLALMRAWLERVEPCPSGPLAAAMCRSARSAIQSLIAPPA